MKLLLIYSSPPLSLSLTFSSFESFRPFAETVVFQETSRVLRRNTLSLTLSLSFPGCVCRTVYLPLMSFAPRLGSVTRRGDSISTLIPFIRGIELLAGRISNESWRSPWQRRSRFTRVYRAGGGNRGESEATDAEKNRRVNVDVT